MGAVLAVCLISGLVGLVIGNTKGKAGSGFLLGAFLGPIGWIIAALLARTPELEAQRQAAIDEARRNL